MRDDPARRERATYPYGLDLSVRYGDMDTNHHLNNVAFTRFFEEGRVRMHHDLGGRERLGFRPIVASITVNYLAEGSWTPWRSAAASPASAVPATSSRRHCSRRADASRYPKR